MPKVCKNPVAVFDFTLPAEGVDHEMIIAALGGLAKKYAFQLEESDTGYKHFQGRVSLIKKRRLGSAINLFSLKPVFAKIHLSITSTAAKGDQLYVLKDDTRVDGPWTDKDDKPLYEAKQYREITKLYPFQEKVLEMCKNWEPRVVNILIDEKGNMGKSTLVAKGEVAGAMCLPLCFDYKDILRMVCNLETTRHYHTYFIDMPRAIKKDRVGQFFSAIETIKGGRAHDDRYHFKQARFDSPNIWVFTNTPPDAGNLTADRWKMWTINSDKELVPYVPIV